MRSAARRQRSGRSSLRRLRCSANWCAWPRSSRSDSHDPPRLALRSGRRSPRSPDPVRRRVRALLALGRLRHRARPRGALPLRGHPDAARPAARRALPRRPGLSRNQRHRRRRPRLLQARVRARRAGRFSRLALDAHRLPAAEVRARFSLRSHCAEPLPPVRPSRDLSRADAGRGPPLPGWRSRRGAWRGAIVSARVVVIGGTGAFGSRLVEGLVATTHLEVIVAARRIAPAQALANELRARHPGRMIETCALNAAAITADDLRRLRAWCVVDAAGPFQGAPPRVAEAAMAAPCHYVDIADARDFVAAFPRLDAAARRANVLAVTGASSTPGVGQAVLYTLMRDWRRIDTIEIAISPGNRQPRGLSVVRAILAGAGQPVRVFRNGRWSTASGMSLLARRRMPGLGRRWLFLIDTPDLDLVPQRFAPRRDAIWRAGLELAFLHLGVWALSRLVSAGVVASLMPLARPLRAVADRFRPFGSRRGGMTVWARGLDARGRAVVATWALVAHERDGPNIPVLPALAVVRALADGRLGAVGAVPCAGALSLADIAREFARFRIVARTMVRPSAVMPRALGRAFDLLPDAIRRAHLVDERLLLQGRASVDGAASAIGRALAWLLGFPRHAADVPVTVEMRVDEAGETWTRTVGGRSFRSRLAPFVGRRITERLGVVTFDLMLTASPAGLDLAIVAGRLGPVPLPRALLPRSLARERVDAAGRFCFDVPIALPGLGLLVQYRGVLVPASGATTACPDQAAVVAAR